LHIFKRIKLCEVKVNTQIVIGNLGHSPEIGAVSPAATQSNAGKKEKFLDMLADKTEAKKTTEITETKENKASSLKEEEISAEQIDAAKTEEALQDGIDLQTDALADHVPDEAEELIPAFFQPAAAPTAAVPVVNAELTEDVA